MDVKAGYRYFNSAGKYGYESHGFELGIQQRF